jgi:orotidine-5'-phosphate decarboxylase
MNFREKLSRAVRSSGSTLCVGLDPVRERIPRPLRESIADEGELIFEFCRRVIEATKVHACAYKPNVAFYEALGSRGWEIYEALMDEIPSNRILIADAKRGDIGNTASMYKKAYFDRYPSDAITLNPLMGMDTLTPFLHDETRCIYVLSMTSNPGAADFLQRRFQGRMSLGEYIAEELSKMQSTSSTELGMVVGATQAEAAGPVLAACPEAHLLIPGIGTQGGSVEQLAVLLQGHKGIPVINSSRSILYAGGDDESWMEMITEKAAETQQFLKPITAQYV